MKYIDRAIEKFKELRQKLSGVDIKDKLANFSWRGLADKIIYSSRATKIITGALLLGSLGGLWRHGVERSNQTIKLAFSEIEKTVREYKAKGVPVPPITLAYSGGNEICAKVFEARNEAMKRGGSDQAFAHELELKVDSVDGAPTDHVWKTISEYSYELPKQIEDALQSMNKYVQAKNEMPSIRDAFESAWTAEHEPFTHEECYTTQERNSDGKMEEVEHCTTVHDSTVHTYTYYPKAGQQAAALLQAFVEKYPDLEIEEKLVPPKKTGADNEYAIWSSHRMLETGENPTEEQYLSFARTWLDGSTFTAETPTILTHYKYLKSLCADWQQAVKTAKNVRHVTYSEFESYDGPKEFRICEDGQRHADNIYASTKEIIYGLEFLAAQAPILDAKIKTLVHEYFSGDRELASDMLDEVVDLAIDLYQKNFKRGMDVTLYNGWMVALFIVLGAAAGAGAGFGAHKLAEIYDEKRGDGRLSPRRRSFGSSFSY